MSKIEYKNRYGDKFTFNKTEDGNVLLEGSFEYMRVGCPNVYEDAYEAYKNDTDENEQFSFDWFKDEIHRCVYNENDEYVGRSEIGEKYGKLVYSNPNIIDMIDPSGGPYLCEHLDLGSFDDSFKGMKIEQFKSVDEGYLIIVKK
jgi:hypothetical protein